jgi:hypothetical protein
MKSCSHVEQVNLGIEGKTKGCEECEKIGSDWVHLRLCLSCGHVGSAVILPPTIMERSISKQLVIP